VPAAHGSGRVRPRQAGNRRGRTALPESSLFLHPADAVTGEDFFVRPNIDGIKVRSRKALAHSCLKTPGAPWFSHDFVQFRLVEENA
jgi:hypothetical protein